MLYFKQWQWIVIAAILATAGVFLVSGQSKEVAVYTVVASGLHMVYIAFVGDIKWTLPLLYLLGSAALVYLTNAGWPAAAAVLALPTMCWLVEGFVETFFVKKEKA